MITFPVKTNKENAALSPLFGKAKYFAFYDGENLTIEENKIGRGGALISWFLNKGVTSIIIKEMGSKPYNKIQNTSMNIYYAGDDRVTTNEVIKNFNDNKLEILDNEKMTKIIEDHHKDRKKQ